MKVIDAWTPEVQDRYLYCGCVLLHPTLQAAGSQGNWQNLTECVDYMALF